MSELSENTEIAGSGIDSRFACSRISVLTVEMDKANRGRRR